MSDVVETRMVQQRPVAWDGMVARVTSAIDPSLPHELQFDAAQVACVEVERSRADGTDVRNHYYALGLAACKFALSIFTPQGAERFVDEAAAAVAKMHTTMRQGRADESGLTIDDLATFGFMFQKTFGEEPLPQPERILADAFSTRAYRQPGKMPDRGVLEFMLRGGETESRVREASTVGGLIVLREVLSSYYESVHGKRPQTGVPLRDFIDSDTFDKLDIIRAAKLSANMSMDRLRAVIKEMIGVDDRAHVRVDGQLAREQRALSDGRSCPALHVTVRQEPEEGLERAVVGLIPHVTGLLMRAVSSAQQKLVPDW